jgi:hypothetical protein
MDGILRIDTVHQTIMGFGARPQFALNQFRIKFQYVNFDSYFCISFQDSLAEIDRDLSRFNVSLFGLISNPSLLTNFLNPRAIAETALDHIVEAIQEESRF